MLMMAQADAVGFSPIEYDLLQRAGLIGAIYGILVLAGLAVALGLIARWRNRPFPWRPALNRLLAWPWQGRDVIGLLALLTAGIAAVMALRLAWLRWTQAWGLAEASSLVLLQSLFFHVLGLCGVIVRMVQRRLTWRDAFGIQRASLPADVLKGAAYLLAALPPLLLLTLLFHVGLHLLGHRPSLQEVAFVMADEPNLWMRSYFVVLAAGLAPVFEEILFRGLLLPVLARRYGAWAALLGTSFLFAVIHGHLPSFAPLFGLSLALGFAYIVSASLLVPIAMHALFNSITLSILLGLS